MNIKVITTPDIIFDQSLKILVINGRSDIKKSLEKQLAETQNPVSTYVYSDSDTDIKWLLTVANISDIIILDMDNSDESTGQFFSYLLSLPATYYRCEHPQVDWGMLNTNRFFELPNFERIL